MDHALTTDLSRAGSWRAVDALPRLAAAGLVAAFCGLAVLNSAGYRYGAADQAFYVPVVRHAQQPELFPRDARLLDAQDRFTIFNEIIADTSTLTGGSLPTLFLALYFVGLAGLAAAAMAIGRRLYGSPWTTAALVLALTLRHRIPKTGANTLEGYFHPRMLAFAIGVAAIATYLRGRSAASLVLVIAAAVLHPTTALWFGLWLMLAILVSEERSRLPVVGVTVTGVAASVWAVTLGPLRDRMVRMDEVWVAALQSKDYIFPTAWSVGTWSLHLLYALVIAIVLRRRLALGLASRRERSLAIGCLALAALFLAALPLIAMRVALAVQLQLSRVFWMLDFLAIAYVVWALAEWPVRGEAPARRRGVIVFAVLAVAASARGAYVMFVEHAGRPVIERTLPADEWTDAMTWIQSTPVRSHVLADPGHAWRYGTSVRVSGERDVFFEEVKDAAVALYSRDVAVRVVDRATAVGDFGALTEARALELAGRYELDWLVADRRFDLPVAYRNGRFSIYRIR